MTEIAPNTLNAAAVAYRESEVIHGSGSYHDNVAAATAAYLQAAEAGDEFAASTATLGIGDGRMQAIEDAIDERLTGNAALREKAAWNARHPSEEVDTLRQRHARAVQLLCHVAATDAALLRAGDGQEWVNLQRRIADARFAVSEPADGA